MTIFAYPVLCPPSDLPLGVSTDSAYDPKTYGYLDLDVALAPVGRSVVARIKFYNQAIDRLISKGDATLTLVIESTASLVRRAIPITGVNSGPDAFEHPFNLDAIGVPLPCEATLFIVSNREIQDYMLPGAPTKLGVNSGLFMPAGSILAYSLTIPLLPQPVKADSIIVVEQQDGLPSADCPKLDCSGQSIRVLLSPDEYRRFDALKANPNSGRIVLYSIIMPALIHAVEVVRAGKDAGDIQDLNWFMSIKSVLHNPPPNLSISDGQSSYEVAHRIMQHYVSLQHAFIPLSHPVSQE